MRSPVILSRSEQKEVQYLLYILSILGINYMTGMTI